MIFFAQCPLNMADLLRSEAERAGLKNIRESKAGIEFEATKEEAYRFLYSTRIASRVLLAIYFDQEVTSSDELYNKTREIPWHEYLDSSKKIKVTCTAVKCPYIKNTVYASQKVKDGICDSIKEKEGGLRPDVDVDNPDITIHIHASEKKVIWYLDYSGENLSVRGWKKESTLATMKENLAAALLYRSSWYKSARAKECFTLLDPFSGSGTIAIEAALIATDAAPGLGKEDSAFAFTRLFDFDKALFDKIKKEAEEIREEGRKKYRGRIIASDISQKALSYTERNAENAGVSDLIETIEKDFRKYSENEIEKSGFCCIVTDPPYGVRMKSDDIDKLYSQFGLTLSSAFKGWDCAIITENQEVLSNIPLKAERTNTLYNGELTCQIAHYHVFTDEERDALVRKKEEARAKRLAEPLSPGAQMAFNRLKKNMNSIYPAMEKEKVTCFRLYDADMPEYSAAIDIYENKWINLSEYKAPESIKEEDAKRRLEELIAATERATGIDRENIFVKTRSRMKGASQYKKLESKNHFYIAHENGLVVLVNFEDYLDTGIFLDHRKVRKLIQEKSDGKRFLNLFCYTATATLNAIKGGAVSTVSVDSSATYLDWALENMKINKFTTTMDNYFYKSDVMDYLYSTYDKFDLIFLDPPTFSNSKDRATLDVQRDHKKLIKAALMHLAPSGELIFSTNYRKFKMDEEILSSCSVRDISEETIGEDYRDRKIHKCYIIKKKVKIKLSEIIRKKKDDGLTLKY